MLSVHDIISYHTTTRVNSRHPFFATKTPHGVDRRLAVYVVGFSSQNKSQEQGPLSQIAPSRDENVTSIREPVLRSREVLSTR